MRLLFHRSHKGFTLVEIMIVVAIIGLLAAIAVPSFIRSRLRSQATSVKNEARMLNDAKDQYALETNKPAPITPQFTDLTPYLKAGSSLQVTSKDTMGGSFTIGDITTNVKVDGATKNTVSEATGGDEFWGPYS
jgi:prepilin-type N-terminal cleavage/methylation domain-containing protein